MPFRVEDDVANFHNLYTSYTALFVMFALGTRPVWGFQKPLVFTPHDRNTLEKKLPKTPRGRSVVKRAVLQPEFCTWRDKDGPDGYHTRLLWMPETLRIHLAHYQGYLGHLLKNCQARNTTQDLRSLKVLAGRTFFFLTITPQGLRAEEINPRRLKEELKGAGYQAAINANRSFLKSEWFERGGPPDVIELFLGHWSLGEEGFTASSALHPADYKHHLAELLPGILNKVGFQMLRPPAAFKKKWRLTAPPVIRPSSNELFWDQDDPPSKLWFTVVAQINADESADKPQFRKWQKQALALVKKHLRELYDAPPILDLDQQRFENFYYSILKKGVKQAEAARRQDLVFRLLECGVQRHGWQIALPKPPAYVSREGSLLRPDMVKSLLLCTRLERVFSRDLEEGLPETIELRVGQILFSAVLYGGLLQGKWLRLLPGALATQVRQHESWLWVDLWNGSAPEDALHRARSQKNPVQYLRWFADPTTQRLIYQLRKMSVENLEDALQQIKADKALRRYLDKICVGKGLGKIAVKRLLRIATDRSMTCLPPFLSAYAQGRLRTANLHDEALLRVLSGRVIPLKRPERKNQPWPRAFRRSFRRSNQKQERQELCKILARAIGHPPKGKRLKEVKKEVRDFSRDKSRQLSPVMQLLCQWALYLLSKKPQVMSSRCYHKPLAFATVCTYISTIGDNLLDVFRGEDPLKLEPDILMARYEILLNRIQETNQEVRKVWETLAQFHYFLGLTYQVPQCFTDIEEIPAAGGRPCRWQLKVLADANVLTEEDFEKVLEILRRGSMHLSRLRRMQICVMILGRRLGMRRSEIMGLRLQDIERILSPEVLVQRHEGRRLKSAAATRRLLLEFMLPPKEYAFVCQWISDREHEPGVNAKDYLFTRTEFHKEMLSDQELMMPLRQIIKSVTGDDTATFHHTRHSFYGNLVCQLLMRDNPHSSMHPNWIQTAEPLDPRLCADVLGNQGTGRGILHVLAIMIGHAGAATGMASYFHHCDWLLGYFSRHTAAVPDLSPGAWQVLCEIRQRSWAEMKKEQAAPFLQRLEKQADRHAEELVHPLMSQSMDRAQFKAKSQKGSQRSFDSVLQALWRLPQAERSRLKLPGNPTERKQLEMMYEFVTGLRADSRNRQLKIIRNLARASTRHGVRVDTLEDARNCLEWNCSFGVPLERIKGIHHPRARGRALHGQPGWRHWQNMLPELTIGSSGSKANSKNRFGCLDISVALHGQATAPQDWVPTLNKLLALYAEHEDAETAV